jgi:hypothetical protein
MSRGSRIVDERFTVQNVEQFIISLNGESNSVAEGYVADEGVVRQFWPPTVIIDDPIVLTTDTELSYASHPVSEGEVRAICNYDARTGRLVLSNEDTVYFSSVLAPPPRSAGQYVCRFTIVSGDITTHFVDDTWHDVFEEGNLGVFENYLPNSFPVQSFVEGQGTFSIAIDDGAGQPVGGTIVSKTIDFKAELIGDNLSFTTAPWQLIDVRYNEPAYCILLCVPSGFGEANEAFITGNEHLLEVVREIYAVEWGPQFTIQVDEVAGSVTGEPTGVPLSTDVRRLWRVDADTPQTSNSATIDVTINDGISSVTKQVTMLAQYDFDGPGNPGDPSEISDDFTQYDNLLDTWSPGQNNEPDESRVTLSIFPDGTLNATGLNNGPYANFPQDWHTDAPATTDANEYEVRLTSMGNALQAGSDATGQWLNLSSLRGWSMFADGTGFPAQTIVSSTAQWLLEVRESGNPSNVKQKQLDVKASVLVPSGGGVNP